MALKKYRRQVIRVRDANDELPEVILSTGDEAGRIIQLVITGGENYGTHCRFWLQKEEGLNVYQDMEQVTASYPTWEAAINTGGLEPGVYPCMFRIGDNDGSVTETFKTTARVLQGMLIDAEESEEMQSQLSEFEQRTEDAIAANETATAAANDAAEAATEATEAIEHALDEVDVRVLTSGVLSVTNVDGVPTSYDVKQQVSDAINPKIEDVDAAIQAANDAATAANSAATSATDAAAAATSVTSAATQAATAANNAATSATSAASDANTATSNANTATTAATNAATAANNAAQTALASVGNMLIGEYEDTTGGQMFTTEDAYKTGTLHGLTVYGKSTQVQDPAPTPDAPQEIKSVVDGSVWLGGRNLVPILESGSFTTNGITVTYSNGIFTFSGTSNTNGGCINEFCKSRSFKLPRGLYYIKSLITGSQTPTGYVENYQTDAIVGTMNPNGTSFTLDNDTEVYIGFNYTLDTVYNGEIKVIISKTPITVTDTDSEGLNFLDFLPAGVEPLRSLPDGTRDVLRIDKDGNGIIERNVGVINFAETSLSFSVKAYTNFNRFVAYIADSKVSTAISDRINLYANHFKASSTVIIAPSEANTIALHEGRIYFLVNNTDFPTTASFTDYLTNVSEHLYYNLATPTTETIPAAVMPQIPSEYLNAWLDASDQNGDAIDPAWGMEYERDLTITINNIESAIADIVSA